MWMNGDQSKFCARRKEKSRKCILLSLHWHAREMFCLTLLRWGKASSVSVVFEPHRRFILRQSITSIATSFFANQVLVSKIPPQHVFCWVETGKLSLKFKIWISWAPDREVRAVFWCTIKDSHVLRVEGGGGREAYRECCFPPGLEFWKEGVESCAVSILTYSCSY